MGRTSLIDRIEPLLRPAVESLGFDLIDLEYLNEHGHWVLRLTIDSEKGITLEDCENVSRRLSPLLDVEDLILTRYHLEVSSPGPERPLKQEKDFQKYAGNVISIRTYEKREGRRNFTGVLKELEGGVVRIIENDAVIEIPREAIFKARLKEVKRDG